MEIINDYKKMTLKEMINNKLILPLTDSNGKYCSDDDSYIQITKLENEYVIKVTGKIVERESKNNKIPTGEIEVEIDKCTVLSEANQTPLIIADKTDALEDVRMKYRYIMF